MLPRVKQKKQKVEKNTTKSNVARLHNSIKKEILTSGPKPHFSTQLFCVQGACAYQVTETQLVPLTRTVWRSADLALQGRSASGRRPLTVNAGKPTYANANAGSCFHNHPSFIPTDRETHETEWIDEKPMRLSLSDSPYCSDADVLARYAGGSALKADGATLFAVIFLNDGSSFYAPQSPTNPDFIEQKKSIKGHLQKMFLVFEGAIDPVFENTERGDWSFETTTHDGEKKTAMLGCFLSILSDKREGSPGSTHQESIAGYHDRCRLHLLPQAHVKKIKSLIVHFQLEADFPLIMGMDGAQLTMAKYRAAAIASIGPQPLTVPTDEDWQFRPQWHEWVTKMLSIPFAFTWVQICNFDNPQGKVDEKGDAVLVPLVRGNVEERNGMPWLDASELHSENSPQLAIIQTALLKICGKEPKQAKSNPDDLKAIRELTASLKQANATVSDQQECITDLQCHVNKSRKREREMTMRFNHAYEQKHGFVEFGEKLEDCVATDARLTVKRISPGVLIIHTPDGIEPIQVSTEGVVTLRFCAA